MDMKIFPDRFKTRLGLKSYAQVILIIIVFSLAGTTVAFSSGTVLSTIGLHADSPKWLRVGVYILLIIPLYQILLLVYGSLLGQFNFFWKREKEIGRWILKRLGIKE